MGAMRSCIPVDLKEKLGLETIRHINAQMANGQTDSVELTEAAYIDIMDRVATESFLVLGSEVLIGQTALESTDLLVDCNRQRVITNPDHPNRRSSAFAEFGERGHLENVALLGD